jgi:hypothetical protein
MHLENSSSPKHDLNSTTSKERFPSMRLASSIIPPMPAVQIVIPKRSKENKTRATETLVID